MQTAIREAIVHESAVQLGIRLMRGEEHPDFPGLFCQRVTVKMNPGSDHATLTMHYEDMPDPDHFILEKAQ